MKPVRVLVWGCGRIARMFHLPHLAAHPSVEVVAVADSDPRSLEAAGELLPQALRFENWAECLEVEASAVVICLPPALHAVSAVAAFEAGLAVYLEKPLALERADGESVVQAWRDAGTVGVMGFNFRFHPRYREARTRLDEIGAVRLVQSRFTSASRTLPTWKSQRTTGGGVLLDLASHHLDLIRFMLGVDVRRIGATTTSREVEEDNAALTMELSDGGVAQASFSMNSVQGQRWDLLGSDGRIGIDLDRPLRLDVQPSSWNRARLRRIRERVVALAPRDILLRPGWEPSFGLSLDSFVDDVRDGRVSGTAATIEDGFTALDLVLTAEEAARSGCVVDVGAR